MCLAAGIQRASRGFCDSMIGQSSSKMRRSYSKWSFSGPRVARRDGIDRHRPELPAPSPSAATGATILKRDSLPAIGEGGVDEGHGRDDRVVGQGLVRREVSVPPNAVPRDRSGSSTGATSRRDPPLARDLPLDVWSHRAPMHEGKVARIAEVLRELAVAAPEVVR